EGHPEREVERPAAFPELPGVAGQRRRAPRWEDPARDGIERIERLTLREGRHQRRGQRERRHTVEVIDLSRPYTLLDLGERGELHELPIPAAPANPRHV